MTKKLCIGPVAEFTRLTGVRVEPDSEDEVKQLMHRQAQPIATRYPLAVNDIPALGPVSCCLLAASLGDVLTVTAFKLANWRNKAESIEAELHLLYAEIDQLSQAVERENQLAADAIRQAA